MTNKDITEILERVNNDINGNPRYVVHFLDLLSLETQDKMYKEYIKRKTETGNSPWFTEILYQEAHKRAKKLGGQKYRAKSFGGGFVFSTYNKAKLIEAIKEQA